MNSLVPSWYKYFTLTFFLQFVPFQKIFEKTDDEEKMKAELAEEVLQEVPEQVVSYMKMVQFTPEEGSGRRVPVPQPRIHKAMENVSK